MQRYFSHNQIPTCSNTPPYIPHIRGWSCERRIHWPWLGTAIPTNISVPTFTRNNCGVDTFYCLPVVNSELSLYNLNLELNPVFGWNVRCRGEHDNHYTMRRRPNIWLDGNCLQNEQWLTNNKTINSSLPRMTIIQ